MSYLKVSWRKNPQLHTQTNASSSSAVKTGNLGYNWRLLEPRKQRGNGLRSAQRTFLTVLQGPWLCLMKINWSLGQDVFKGGHFCYVYSFLAERVLKSEQDSISVELTARNDAVYITRKATAGTVGICWVITKWITHSTVPSESSSPFRSWFQSTSEQNRNEERVECAIYFVITQQILTDPAVTLITRIAQRL